jgi:hypothetical protein
MYVTFATIPLTHGFEAVVDLADYELVSSHRWHLTNPDRRTRYAATNLKIGDRYHLVRMHRMILGAPVGMAVDHIDGNGLNNRRINLRMCSQSQNMRNRRAYGRSRFLGVALDTSSSLSKPWKTMIGYRSLGRFATEEEAALAYDVAAIAEYGEFARPNFPNHHPDHMAAARKVMD